MEKDKTKIYISGPISGHDFEQRRQAFKKVEERIRAVGYTPVNPIENGLLPGDHWENHMRADLRMLLECNAIFLMEGWEHSKGCKLEMDVASSCGIHVIIQHSPMYDL
jgi:hypothetical protein